MRAARLDRVCDRLAPRQSLCNTKVYAKFGPEHLTAAAARIERGRDGKRDRLVTFLSRSGKAAG